MRRTIMGLALAGSALLLLGAGCAAGTQTGYQTPPAPSAQPQANGQKDTIDTAADAYVKGATDEQAAASGETGDAAALNSTDNEMSAYGQAYDQSEI